MFKILQNYLLCFLIIFSNVATVVYVYPLLMEYILTYELNGEFSLKPLCFYLGILFTSYEVSKLIGTFFWNKLSIRIGFALCINISLVSLALLNFLLSFTSGFYSALLVRTLTGLFNNISCLSKVYFFDLFSSDTNEKVIPMSSISANISTVIGFVLGGLLPTSNVDISNDSLGGFSFSLNKFFISCWVIAGINLFTFIFNLIRVRCDFKRQRRSVIQENIDIQIKEGQKEKEKDNISLSSIGSIKKPSLVLFDTSNRKETIEKNNNNNIDQIIEKDDNIEDYSSRRNESLGGKKIQNDSSMRNKKIEVDMKTNQYGNIIINNNININYNDSSKNYIQIQNNPQNESKLNSSNINTNNNVFFTNDGVKPSARHINPPGTDGFTSVIHNKLIFTIENNISPNGKQEENPKSAGKMNSFVENSFNSGKFQEIVISEKRGSKNLAELQDEKLSSKRQEGYSSSSKKYKKSMNLISNLNVDQIAFKISIIYTTLQLSESIIYNLLFCCLLAKSTFSYDYRQISFIFFLLHLIYTIFYCVGNSLFSKYIINKEKTLVSNYLKGLIVTSFILTIFFPIFYIFQPMSTTLNLLMTCVFFLMRDITISLGITCYNCLIMRMENNKIKSKINTFHTYITTLLKAIFCLILYITCGFILEMNLNYSFIVCGFAGLLFFLGLGYIDSLENYN